MLAWVTASFNKSKKRPPGPGFTFIHITVNTDYSSTVHTQLHTSHDIAAPRFHSDVRKRRTVFCNSNQYFIFYILLIYMCILLPSRALAAWCAAARAARDE